MLDNVRHVSFFIFVSYCIFLRRSFAQITTSSLRVPSKVHQDGTADLTNSSHTTNITLPQGSFINLGGKQPANGDCFRQFANLRQRFNWEQLEFFCQKWRSYNEVIFSNLTNETQIPMPFTNHQKIYLDSLKIVIDVNDNAKYPKAVRKEYRSMTENERLLFIFAIRSLKRDKIDGVSKYDLIVTLRHPALAPGAQVGAAFMPWHREYLRT